MQALSTGQSNYTSNPLSATTVGALMDPGYEVNFGAAGAYIVPGAGMIGSRAVPRELPMPPPRVVH